LPDKISRASKGGFLSRFSYHCSALCKVRTASQTFNPPTTDKAKATRPYQAFQLNKKIESAGNAFADRLITKSFAFTAQNIRHF